MSPHEGQQARRGHAGGGDEQVDRGVPGRKGAHRRAGQEDVAVVVEAHGEDLRAHGRVTEQDQ